MDESPDQIEEHIRSTREELGTHFRELESRLKNATNWRLQFERHTLLFVGAALAGGFLLSGAFPVRRHTKFRPERAALPRASGTRAFSDGFAKSDVWDVVKTSLAAAAGSQISSLLGRALLGSLGKNEPPR